VLSLTSITLLIAPFAGQAETHPQARAAKADGMRAWREGNYVAAMNVLAPFADEGDPAAQNALGEILLSGKTAAMGSEAAATAWFRKAAFQGFARAQVNVGFMLEKTGRGAAKAEAAGWYRRAAVQGFPAGQHHLARLYEVGEGVQRNIGLAVFWYTKAVAQNYALSQFAFGRMRRDGIGISRNLVDARRWFQKAAQQSLPEAWQALEELHFAGVADQRRTANTSIHS
jgi:TPR repeat protein